MKKSHLFVVVVFVLGAATGALGAHLLSPRPPAASQDPALSGTRISEGTVVAADADTATFTHQKLGFSLSYPKRLLVTEFDEGQGARTIVFQEPGETSGFQIFIVPYKGTTITPERIRKDIPSGVVRDPVEAIIGDGIRATVFWSESPGVGETREAWFIHDGYLYEATAYAAQDAMLGEILSTLDFK